MKKIKRKLSIYNSEIRKCSKIHHCNSGPFLRPFEKKRGDSLRPFVSAVSIGGLCVFRIISASGVICVHKYTYKYININASLCVYIRTYAYIYTTLRSYRTSCKKVLPEAGYT